MDRQCTIYNHSPSKCSSSTLAGGDPRVQHIPRSIRQHGVLCGLRGVHDSGTSSTLPGGLKLCRALAEPEGAGGLFEQRPHTLSGS